MCLAQSNIRQRVDKLFMSNGFRVEIINYEGIAESYGKDFASGHNNSILFAAEQLLHSDDQVRHFVFRFTWYSTVVCIKHNNLIRH